MEYKKALERAAHLCSQQERCKSEIAKKLKDWELNEEEIEKALAYLLRENFINEQRFANFYARDKFRFNGWGRIKIKYQLKIKDLDSVCIAEALNLIDETSYIDRLNELMRLKRKQVKNKDEWQTKAALIRFAQSRGFEPDLIYRIMDQQQSIEN